MIILILPHLRVLPATVLSRCQLVRFPPRTVAGVPALLPDVRGEARVRSLRLLAEAREHGVEAILRLGEQVGRDRAAAETFVEACWLWYRDLLCGLAGGAPRLAVFGEPGGPAPAGEGSSTSAGRAARLPRGLARAAGQRVAAAQRGGVAGRSSSAPRDQWRPPHRSGRLTRAKPLEPAATAAGAAEETPQYLIGVRLRQPLLAEDHLTTETDLHVGDLVVVETGGGSAVGEVRRPRRPLP